MDKKLACTHCDAETWVFRDLVAGMPHVDCPQGDGLWFEPANTGLQADRQICPDCGADIINDGGSCFYCETKPLPAAKA